MSITVRLWSDQELQDIHAGIANPNLITTFMNVTTFGEKEIRFYPYHLRKTYRVEFHASSPVTVYAVDDKSLIWFLSKEYHLDAISDICEIVKRYIDWTPEKLNSLITNNLEISKG